MLNINNWSCTYGSSKCGQNKKADVQPTAAVTSVEDEEERLANILSQIDGAGEVSVMITYYSSSEKNIAYETKVSSREKEESEDKKAVMTDGEPMVVKRCIQKSEVLS